MVPVPLCSLPEQRGIVRILEEQFTVIEDHRRRNRPLSTWRDGKVVYLDPHDLSVVRENAAPCSTATHEKAC